MNEKTMLQNEPGYYSKILAVMSYLGILTLIPLVLSGKNTFVRFHARQGVVLWMWEVLAVYGLIVPGLGRIFFSVSSILCVGLSIIGLIAVLTNRAWKFPIIGSLAEKL